MLKRLVKWWRGLSAAPAPAAPAKRQGLRVRHSVAARAGLERQELTPPGATLPRAETAFKLPAVPPGVIPKTAKMAADNAMAGTYPWAIQSAISEGLAFPGFPYLSELCQRAEYRRPAEILAQHMTRKWIKLKATGDDGESKADKLREIEAELTRLNAQETFKQALQQDGFFGRAQVFIDCGDDSPEELKTPLSASAAKITKGSLRSLRVIEPIWTYPHSYNSINPLKDDFFKPTAWFVLGKEIHASRLLTIISRPVPDLLKPSYIFGGISLSQLAKPYVDNWLRTRQSVSDLIAAFNVFVLKTNMAAIVQGSDDPNDADGLFGRLDLFNRLRDNRGVFALDKDSEDFTSISAPLGGLDHLQAQSQEHMSAVYGIPLVHLLGITPTGLNASSEGEHRAFDDWIGAQQESHLRPPLEKTIDLVQLSLYGEIDPEIGFEFVPLSEKSETEQATIRKTNADTAAVLIDKGVIDAEEERARLAKEEGSLYASLDLTKVIEAPQDEEAELQDLLAGQNPTAPGAPPQPRSQPGAQPAPQQ